MQNEIGQESFERGAELQRAGHFADAAEVYLRLAEAGLTINLAMNLGACLNAIGDRNRAQHFLGLAARQRPGDATIHRLLGAANAEAGYIELAEHEFRDALAAKPGDGLTELALASLYLSVGRYAEGWPLMAARTVLNPGVVPPITVNFPEWRGEPLAGKSVLIWVEQGFGDQIQMARFANSLKTLGAARVTLGCRPVLADLFATIAGADAIIPIAVGGVAEAGTHDYWTRYFSVAEPLGVTLETIPGQPYLSAPADRRAQWAGFANGARVGLAWRASPTGFNAANKGMSDDVAQRVRDAGAISLLPEDTGAADFADTAAIIENLDLVISIDSAVAHLAGAMGKPCWTLLPYIHCDWRWLRGRSDSPWYPTMTLYRQTAPRDWSRTVDQVLRDLGAAGLGAA